MEAADVITDGKRDRAATVVMLFVSVPIACFRAPQAREYLETLPVPPPSTVYGMLLSLTGEPNRLIHVGAQIAFVLLSGPVRSTVLRTAWRIKNANVPPGMGSNKRPDFQELLSDVRLAVAARPGPHEVATPTLAGRLRQALQDPTSIRRFGGLSLGESTHLVDEVRALRDGDLEEAPQARTLVADQAGNFTLPIWPDHVGSRGTRWGQFRLEPSAHPVRADDLTLPESAWITISPPNSGGA